MKSENAMTHKKTQLKVHKMINNQMKDESLCIQTQIVIWNEDSLNVSCQFVTTLKKQLNQQTSVIITTHDC